jgi:hypothetical protein
MMVMPPITVALQKYFAVKHGHDVRPFGQAHFLSLTGGKALFVDLIAMEPPNTLVNREAVLHGGIKTDDGWAGVSGIEKPPYLVHSTNVEAGQQQLSVLVFVRNIVQSHVPNWLYSSSRAS